MYFLLSYKLVTFSCTSCTTCDGGSRAGSLLLMTGGVSVLPLCHCHTFCRSGFKRALLSSGSSVELVPVASSLVFNTGCLNATKRPTKATPQVTHHTASRPKVPGAEPLDTPNKILMSQRYLRIAASRKPLPIAHCPHRPRSDCHLLGGTDCKCSVPRVREQFQENHTVLTNTSVSETKSLGDITPTVPRALPQLAQIATEFLAPKCWQHVQP